MDDQTKNLLLATGLSFLVIFVWFVLFPPEQPAPPMPDHSVADAPVSPATPAPQAADGVAATPPAGVPATATVPGTAPSAAAIEAVTEARVTIETERLTGSLSLTGARIDDLALNDYRESLEERSPNVRLLSPAGANGAYYALHGWVGAAEAGELPGPATPWEVEAGDVLT
ncbi:MAG: membrane protein insertase YidC, partial [Pseudomonadota bacterium]